MKTSLTRSTVKVYYQEPEWLVYNISLIDSVDFSNYWTASLYFKARNGSFKRVPQLTNLGLKGKNGGLTVYYNSPYDGKTKTTAFKPVSLPR